MSSINIFHPPFYITHLFSYLIWAASAITVTALTTIANISLILVQSATSESAGGGGSLVTTITEPSNAVGLPENQPKPILFVSPFAFLYKI